MKQLLSCESSPLLDLWSLQPPETKSSEYQNPEISASVYETTWKDASVLPPQGQHTPAHPLVLQAALRSNAAKLLLEHAKNDLPSRQPLQRSSCSQQLRKVVDRYSPHKAIWDSSQIPAREAAWSGWSSSGAPHFRSWMERLLTAALVV